MRKFFSKVFILSIFLCFGHEASSQLGWIQKATFPGAPRDYDAGWAIGNYGYIGLGWNGTTFYDDIYQWSPATNTWSAIPVYPGLGRLSPVTFVIEGKVYITTGWAVTYGANDTWCYDPGTNTWTAMANFPGSGRYDANGFVLGHKGYLISGSTGGPPYVGDMWVYDAHTNTWKHLNNPPSGKVDGAASFAIGNHGYYAGGWNGGVMSSTAYEYDTTTDTWTPIASMPNYNPGVSGDSRTWVYGSKAYVFNGHDAINHTFTQGWVYDTVTKAWCEFTDMGKMQRSYPAAYVLNNKFYYGTGLDSLGGYHSDYWQFDPVTYIGVSDTVLCGNDSVHFAGLSTYDSIGSVTWNWSFPGGTPSTSTIENPSVYYTTSGVYTATLIVDACAGSDTVSRTITVTTGGAGGPYTITGKSPICSGNSDTITASGGATYKWSNGATTSTLIVTPASTTTYSVVITSGCAVEDTSIVIVVNPSPNLVIGSPADTICNGFSVSLNASGANSYLWTPPTGLSCTTCPNPTATSTISTTYTVIGSDPDGCSETQNVSVYVSSAPVLAQIPNQTICSGNAVTLVANQISGYYGTFTWEPGGSTNGTITVSPSDTTTYTLNYTNVCGTTSTNVTVFVNPSPTPNFSTDIMQGCAPLCMQFRDMSTIPAGTISMWRWIFGNGDTSDIENPIYCYPDSGTFSPSLTATSTDGCSSTLKNIDMITVFSRPVANFIYTPLLINYLEPNVQFTDESTDAYGITYWQWNFGDGQAVNGQNDLRNPSHSYGDTGTFCPQLVVVNNKGCIDTATNCLEIYPIFTLYIPTAFSPNSDGVDDFFTPKGSFIKSFDMYIFDRWGMELYQTNDITKGWDGTIRGGLICQEDNYVYTITAIDWSGKEHSYVGQFSLIK